MKAVKIFTSLNSFESFTTASAVPFESVTICGVNKTRIFLYSFDSQITLKAFSYLSAFASPTTSIGFLTDASAVNTAFSFSFVSSLGTAKSNPYFSQESLVTTPTPPALVIIANLPLKSL